ncbi:hypothetical protein [Bacillus thuringiensis]
MKKSIYSKIYQRLFSIINMYSLNIEHYPMPKDLMYSLKKMNTDILLKLKYQYGNEIDQEKYEILLNRLLHSQNEIGYVITNNEQEICGYFHLVKDEMKSGGLGKKLKLSHDIVVLFDDYTFLKHRGKGVHKYSILARINKAREMGFMKANVLIHEGNTPSERAYLSFDFQKTIRYKVLKIKKYKFVFTKRLENEY